MENIEMFNIATAEVFGQCYKSFPVPIELVISDLENILLDTRDNQLDPDVNVGYVYEIAENSVEWLIESGYLWCKAKSSNEFYDVTLTPKGLEILNAIPDGLEQKRPLGELFSKGIKTLGKETALSAVNLGLSLGVNLIFRK